jgi:hypothetical protein
MPDQWTDKQFEIDSDNGGYLNFELRTTGALEIVAEDDNGGLTLRISPKRVPDILVGIEQLSKEA